MSKKDSKYNEGTKEWFIINSDWLKDWKMFVNNKRSSTAYGTRKSDKKDVGILDPGPITNYQLFGDDKTPLQDLVKGKHYRGVNREVWLQLYKTYGGGPIIRRNELSIYAPEYEEPEPSELDFDIIKNHSGDENIDEANLGDDIDENEQPAQKVMQAKHNIFDNKKRSGILSAKHSSSKIQSYKTGKYGAGSNARENKSNSITRRNLFMKKSFKSHEVEEIKNAKDEKSPSHGSKKQPIYQSLLEQRDNSNEIFSRYRNKSKEIDFGSKKEDAKEHKVEIIPKSSRDILSNKLAINSADKNDNSGDKGGYKIMNKRNIFKRQQTDVNPKPNNSKLKNLFSRQEQN